MIRLLFGKRGDDVNLWIIPFKMSMAALLLFGLTMIPDVLAAYKIIHIPDWLTMGGIDDARAILGAMLGCVSTVLALIFSVALLVLSMVATLFGPRLLYRFVQDWVTQTTIGLFMAAFIYVFLVFLVTHQDPHSSFVPEISLIMCWLLVMSAFSFLVYYSHRIAVSIQNPDAIARITDDFRDAVQASNGNAVEPLTNPFAALKLEEAHHLTAKKSGYLQKVEHQKILEIAVDSNLFIAFLFRPGQFILADETIAYVWSNSESKNFLNAVESYIHIGRHRVLRQDIEFGIAQIVEVAIRALSPAVNDTFTGVACVDWMGEALVTLSKAKPCATWTDTNATARLTEPELKIHRLIKFAFDQIRQAAIGNPAVLIRMLIVIKRIAKRFKMAAELQSLLNQSNAICDTARSSDLIEADLVDIEKSWKESVVFIETRLQTVKDVACL